MIVFADDGPARTHLARALDAHLRWCRTNHIPIPPDVLRLRDAVSDGLERTNGDGLDVLADAAPVPDALDYRTAADRLSVSDRTVRRLVKSGDLPAVDIGGCRRIRSSDLSAYLDGLTSEGDSDAQ